MHNQKNKENIQEIILKIILVIVSIYVVILIGLILNETFITPQIKYTKANKLIDEKKYNEAIEVLEEIVTYKDSTKKIEKCNEKIREENEILKEQKEKELSKYIGSYDKTEYKTDELNGDQIPYGDYLTISRANSEGITFYFASYGHRNVSFGTTAKLKNELYEFTFTDSWQNSGKGRLELLEDGVRIITEVDELNEDAWLSTEEGKFEFKFSDMVEE